MTIWFLAIILFVPPFTVSTLGAMRGTANNRLVAVQLAGAFAAQILTLMTFAFDQSAFIDLALCLTLLGVPGTFLMTTFMERWL